MPTCVSIESLIVTLSLYYTAVHTVTEPRTAGLTQVSEDDTMTNVSKSVSAADGTVAGPSSSGTVLLEFLSVQNLGVVVQNSTRWRYWEPISRRKSPPSSERSRSVGGTAPRRTGRVHQPHR